MGHRKLYAYRHKDLDLPKHRIQKIANKFPHINYTDRVSNELWGILNTSYSREDTLRAITNTFQTHLYSNAQKDPNKEARQNLWKLENRSQKLKWILKSWWTWFEFFMVDCLQRNRFHFKNMDLFHTKASPVLDYKRKIDFLSTVIDKSQETNESITIWVQLTTEKSHIRIYPDYRDHMKKKKYIVHELSEKCINNDDPYIKQLPERLQPRLTSYMVVNWSINKRINIDNDNIFLKAFEQREEHWFNKWWPSQYLPEFVQKELGIIYHAYQRSLKQFIEFIHKNKTLPDTEIYHMTSHENIYHLVSTYNPDNKELQYKVFYDNKDWESIFLFYISYFLHNNISQKQKII